MPVTSQNMHKVKSSYKWNDSNILSFQSHPFPKPIQTMLRKDRQTESKLYWPCHTDPGNTPPALLQPNPTRIPPSRHKSVTVAMWGPGTVQGKNTCTIYIDIQIHTHIYEFTHSGIKGALTWGAAPLGEFSGHYKLPGMEQSRWLVTSN